jgi:hypothetical protein
VCIQALQHVRLIVFLSMVVFYFLQIIMFVYDVTNFSSFENLDDWRLHVEKCVKDSEAHKPKFALVANKSMKLCIHVCTVTSVLKIIG